MDNGDPRLSLEERYTNHLGYVEAVKKAAARAVRLGFLLPADADALVAQAAASNVLNPLATASPRSAGTGGARTDQTR